jgi:hypothetical protein
MAYNTDRTQYIAGLRELADLLDKHDDLPVPTHGDIHWLLFSMGSADTEHLAKQKATAATIVRRLGGAQKDAEKGDLFDFTRTLGGEHGLELQVTVDRDAVCERVVVATHEVTETIPDPTVSVPLVEVTKTVEEVEWRCLPLLAGAEVQS